AGRSRRPTPREHATRRAREVPPLFHARAQLRDVDEPLSPCGCLRRVGRRSGRTRGCHPVVTIVLSRARRFHRRLLAVLLPFHSTAHVRASCPIHSSLSFAATFF